MTFGIGGLSTIEAALPQAATNQSWAKLLLTDAGVPTTDNNVNNVMSWMAAEEPASNWFDRNNPLNSGQGPSGGGSGLGSYADLNTAAFYTAQLINEPNMSGIQQALAANAPFPQFLAAIVASPWDTGYDNGSSVPAPGSVPIVTDTGATINPGGQTSGSGNSGGFNPADVGAPIAPPAPGMASNISADQFFINAAPMDLDVSNALIDIGLTLDATQASVLTMTLHDPPPRNIINSIALQQASVVTFGTLMFEMVSVEKQGSTVTATFEPWVVAALRSAIGAFTLPPGIMTRTDFASLLVGQVQGAVFTPASPSYLFTLDAGYDANTKEQLSRGTTANPLEDSWTCLQRLASEIGWRCYESDQTVFFGPDSFLMSVPPVASLSEATNGIQNIDGTFDVGQPLGTLTIGDVSGSWAPLPGACVTVTGLGALSGPWLVVTLERDSLLQPDITITLQQPQPSLPEPTTGGAQAAVGAGFGQTGNQQSTGGSAAAQQALQYCINQLGVPYQWGGDNPQTGFDCSGLMQAAYESAGVSITRTTYTQMPEFPAVPPGIDNLRPGDLVFFGTTGNPTHVGMFVSADGPNDTAKMIDAPDTGSVVRYDDFQADIGANWGGDQYLGANRPSP